MQESFLFYHLFLNFFVYVVISYNDVCAPFKLTLIKLEHTFTSSIAYCSTFNMAWQFKWKTRYHKGTHVKAKVKVIRFNHSFFTYMIILLDKSNEFNNAWIAMTTLTFVMHFKNTDNDMNGLLCINENLTTYGKNVMPNVKHPKNEGNNTSNTWSKRRIDIFLPNFVHNIQKHFIH